MEVVGSQLPLYHLLSMALFGKVEACLIARRLVTGDFAASSSAASEDLMHEILGMLTTTEPTL